MDNPKQTGKRRKARRRKKDEHCSYVIEAQDWHLNYSLSLNDIPKILSGTFLESLRLEIKGIIREPGRYADKQIDLAFIGDRSIISRIAEREEPETRPNGIGSITLRGEQREAMAVVPFDVIPTIKSLLEAKEIQCIRFYGLATKYGSAYLDSIYFQKAYSPDEQ
jgi:hypothetical protein